PLIDHVLLVESQKPPTTVDSSAPANEADGVSINVSVSFPLGLPTIIGGEKICTWSSTHRRVIIFVKRMLTKAGIFLLSRTPRLVFSSLTLIVRFGLLDAPAPAERRTPDNTLLIF